MQMTLTVELGRTKMYIKDILGLGEGSIIELDKLAGEPVDLLVNGKLIAKGEVVAVGPGKVNNLKELHCQYEIKWYNPIESVTQTKILSTF